jgi:hypothetical protein
VRWQGKKSVTVTKGEFFERVRKAHKLDRKPVHRKRYSNAFVRCRRERGQEKVKTPEEE